MNRNKKGCIMKSIQNILAVIDDFKLSRDILKRSIELAQKFNANIIILYTVQIPFFDLPYYKKEVPIDKNRVKNRIDTIFNSLNSTNIKHHTLVYFGDSSDRAIIEAKRDNIDLIIIGEQIKFEKLLRESQKSLLIIKREYKEYKNILIPTDLTLKSKNSIEFSKRTFNSADFSLVYGYESVAVAMSMYDIGYIDMIEYQEENREIALNIFKDFQKDVGVIGELTDSMLSLNYGILDYIKRKNPDLVVVASHSSEDSFFVGSTSSYLAKETPSDIFIFN
jgi:nucleotide-binding universal stress UspA family protein